MRRSIRDAIVGFSLVGGLAAFSFSMLWLRGISLNAKSWEITAKFANANGLAKRSPVTYRGILIGSVKDIDITPNSVKAKLQIDNQKLRLPLPVYARLTTSSLLGGDVQVALISKSKKLIEKQPYPMTKSCKGNKVLCEGDKIDGLSLASISTLTNELEQILKKAESQDVISNLVDSTKQFDLTQKKLEELVMQVQAEINRAEPIITNLTAASNHISNILSAIDNPKTLNDIQETANSTNSITKKIDNFGSDVEEIMKDEVLMKALRNIAIGLGELFNELYPSKAN